MPPVHTLFWDGMKPSVNSFIVCVLSRLPASWRAQGQPATALRIGPASQSGCSWSRLCSPAPQPSPRIASGQPPATRCSCPATQCGRSWSWPCGPPSQSSTRLPSGQSPASWSARLPQGRGVGSGGQHSRSAPWKQQCGQPAARCAGQPSTSWSASSPHHCYR